MGKHIEHIWTDKKRTFLGLPISFTRYFLTDKKIICRTGFFNITEDEINIYKITDKKLINVAYIHIVELVIDTSEFLLNLG